MPAGAVVTVKVAVHLTHGGAKRRRIVLVGTRECDRIRIPVSVHDDGLLPGVDTEGLGQQSVQSAPTRLDPLLEPGREEGLRCDEAWCQPVVGIPALEDVE